MNAVDLYVDPAGRHSRPRHFAPGRHRAPEDEARLRLRSGWTIAIASVVPVWVLTVLVTGSLPLALLVAVGTAVGVALAGIVI